MTQQPIWRQPYELPHKPDQTAFSVRQNLAAIIERELVGPMYGPNEVIPVAPGTAYIIGRIAPKKLDHDDAPTDADAPDELDVFGSANDARQSTGVPVAVTDDSPVDADEDAAEDQGPRRGLMIPASMGLRFQVPLDLDAVTVTASWGTYKPRKATVATDDADREDQSTTAKRRPPTEYVRTDHQHAVTLDLASLRETKSHRETVDDHVTLVIDASQQPDRLLVEIALCNDRTTPSLIPTELWMFQTQLVITADDAPVFLPVRDPLTDAPDPSDDAEVHRLALQYRDRLEYGIGRTCSVTWTEDSAARRATEVRTTWVPTAETPRTQAQADPRVITDMRRLATASVEELRAGLTPIVEGYDAWFGARQIEAQALPEQLRPTANEVLHEATLARGRLADGIEFLLGDSDAQLCFAFMNHVMAEQRVHSQIAELRAKDPTLDLPRAQGLIDADGPKAHSWYLFQLAFVLMQLPALCQPSHERRANPHLASVELLFFPTGGGKTEAYLGLAAFTFAIRRLQGTIAGADGPLDGSSGLAVLMRYTLRLLTAQQFQRATTMVCAAEIERSRNPQRWGDEPFRIGLWVGSAVSPKRVDEADEQLRNAIDNDHDFGLTVLQIKRCPWCGAPISKSNIYIDTTTRRVFVRCSDTFDCPFRDGGEVPEGLPILTVDEEIYRLAPAFVIATVDKFARLAREGHAATLFGYVSDRCERHGYVHPDYQHCDIQDGSRHPRRGQHAAATRRPASRLRPPDLIIQDELHLISGALGTTVGLFEMAIDQMCSWTTPDGHSAGPLIVASSATVRNAADQVRGLYGRQVAIFPPQVLDVGDTYFSREVPITPETPGRLYLGICASGVRLTNAEVRVSEVLLAAGQLLLDRHGDDADPYLTLIGYFNSIRELAGMKRLIGDDVQTALSRRRPWSRLPRRSGLGYGELSVEELTARAGSDQIGKTLDQLFAPFLADFDSTEARRAMAEARDLGHPTPDRPGQRPFDAVLATSMLQVGVDVQRLGLMLIVGQPKNTAEYIQASSRVGRRPQQPGLVVTLGNWARPRDLAHFEQFRHYHETFYSQVEALSVTPFSPTSIERGTDGLLVSAARVLQGTRRDGLSPERGATHVHTEAEFLSGLTASLVARSERASDADDARRMRERLINRVEHWIRRRDDLLQRHQALVYERVRGSAEAALMLGAEQASQRSRQNREVPFVVANSMREVQPEINLLVSPDPRKLFVVIPPDAPTWDFPPPDEEASDA